MSNILRIGSISAHVNNVLLRKYNFESLIPIIEGHLVDDKGELDELCVMRYEV
jgi:hypothetical protein